MSEHPHPPSSEPGQGASGDPHGTPSGAASHGSSAYGASSDSGTWVASGQTPPYPQADHGQQGPYAQGAYTQSGHGQQPAYSQPAYGQPAYGQAPAPRPSGLAVTSLILGIVALVLGFLPFIGLISVFLGLAAVIIGIIALRRLQPRGLAIAGIVTGALGIVTAILITTVLSVLTARVAEEAAPALSSLASSLEAEASAVSAAASGEHDVEIIASVSSGVAAVDYTVGDATSVEMISDEEQTLMETVEGAEDVDVTVSPDPDEAEAPTGVVYACEILIDGRSVSSDSGTDGADCQGDALTR